MIKGTKYIIGLIVITLMIFAGCKKDDGDEQKRQQEHQEIQQYADDNGLSGQFTESGLYYQIIDEGGSNKPNLGSTVTVSYDGYYLDGTPLDQGSFFTSLLNNLIEGWKEGIQKIGTGGTIKLIIPSHLAYGNGVLVFDVDLHYFS